MKSRAFFGLAVLLSAGSVAESAIIARYDANSLALADGASVTSWSGTGPALGATGTAQPTYRASGMNGLPSLEFDGTSDVLKTGAAVNGARTIVAVAIADTGIVSLAGLVSTGGDKLNVRINGTSSFYRSEGQLGDNNDFYRHDTAVAGDDGLYVNNIVSGSFVAGTSHIVLSQSNTAANYADFWLGSASTSLGRYWKGDIAEIVVFDQELTADERAGVARNLSVKWNFASPLTATGSQIAAANALGVPVPEPTSLALAVLATAGLLGRRRTAQA